MGAVVAIIAAAKQRQLIDAFLERRATAPERAIDSNDLPSSSLRWVRRLESAGILERVESGRLYLDTAALREYERRRARASLAVVVVAIVLVIGFFLAGIL
jgi:hypothetical protein